MNLKEKRRFLRDLIGSVQASLLANVHRVPEEWDGHELRRWIADHFAENAYTLKNMTRRLRAYKQARAVNNL